MSRMSYTGAGRSRGRTRARHERCQQRNRWNCQWRTRFATMEMASSCQIHDDAGREGRECLRIGNQMAQRHPSTVRRAPEPTNTSIAQPKYSAHQHDPHQNRPQAWTVRPCPAPAPPCESPPQLTPLPSPPPPIGPWPSPPAHLPPDSPASLRTPPHSPGWPCQCRGGRRRERGGRPSAGAKGSEGVVISRGGGGAAVGWARQKQSLVLAARAGGAGLVLLISASIAEFFFVGFLGSVNSLKGLMVMSIDSMVV